MRWRLVGRICAICGTVSGPSTARLRMKPNAPPPQLVMSPVFWPRARILKKHWATSSISSAMASLLCRADAMASVPPALPASLVDTMGVKCQNDTLVVILGTDRGMNDTATAGVIARPPLLFLAALLLGSVSDHMLLLPFPVPMVDPIRWVVAGSLTLMGLALAATGIRNFSRSG